MYIFWVILFFISSTIVVAMVTEPPAQNNLEPDTEVKDVGELIYQTGSSSQKKYPPLKLVQSSVQITSKSPYFPNENITLNNNAYFYLQAPLQKKLVHLCPAENQNDIHYLEENSNLIQGMQYCLFEKVYEGAEEMCSNQVKPVLKAELNSQDSEKCANGRELYAFGFHNCGILELLRIRIGEIRSQRQDLFCILGTRYDPVIERVYHVCLDNAKKTIWTKHRVMVSKSESVAVPSSIVPENWTEISIDPCTTDGIWFSNNRQFFQKQDSSSPIVMQTMVPKEHITPAIWNTATKHIINIAPLYSHLVPLMYAINDGIKKAAIKIQQLNPKLNIFLDNSVLKEKYDLDIYTASTTNYDVWCKLVYHPVRKHGIMIIIHNNPPEGKMQKKYCHGITLLGGTKTVSCNFPTWTQIKDPNLSKWSSNAYCCQATPNLVKQFFSMELEVKDVLDLQKIILGKPKRLNPFKLTSREIKKLYGTEIERVINEL